MVHFVCLLVYMYDMCLYLHTDFWAADLFVPARHLAHICPQAAGPAPVSEEGRVSRSVGGPVV